MILVIIGVLVLGGFGVLAWFVIGGAVWLEKSQEKAESNADATLNSLFDGREDVTFELNLRSLKYDTVLLGAKQRGYKLAHQALRDSGMGTLVFEKVAAVADEQAAVTPDS